MAVMSGWRMRVASSDWCASRMVVSVMSTRSCASIHFAKPSAPSSSSFCFVPGGGALATFTLGRRASTMLFGFRRPFTSGLPLTMVSPMNERMRVARSRFFSHLKSSGVSSMNLVVYSAVANFGCVMTWSRKRRLVDTPRMRNSHNARCMRAMASTGFGAHAVTFTSMESYERVRMAPA